MEVWIRQPEGLFTALSDSLDIFEYDCDAHEMQKVMKRVFDVIDCTKTSEYWHKRNDVMFALYSFLKYVWSKQVEHEKYGSVGDYKKESVLSGDFEKMGEAGQRE